MKESRTEHSLPNIALDGVIAHGGSAVVKRGRTADGAECAVKIIHISSQKRLQEVSKEAKIHKLLVHKHIVKLKDIQVSAPYFYLVMEYAERNELFSYIDPGSGMAEDLCHLYLQQLHSALQYMHSRGICHRDIKPENILLDRNYNLLLTDFGCATVYRDAHERKVLSTFCGSPNYIAPEVYNKEYDGELADVWSFGMVAVVIMSGVVPWKQSTVGDPMFEKYKLTTVRDFSPFNLLSKDKLVFVESILQVDPQKRHGLSKIKENAWFRKKNMYTGPDGLIRNPEIVGRLLLPAAQTAFSQPDACISPVGKELSSQPVFMSYDSMPMSTRVYLQNGPKRSIERLCAVFEELLIQHKAYKNTLSFNTVDGSKNTLSGEVIVRSIGCESALIFQRTRGNCIEFKRMFNIVKERLHEAPENIPRNMNY
ncbi:serine/threonine-protein kinase CHEK1 [Nematocida sp. AWRm77]|nr:serine/threonine-protein kinase CHEK1 [Nematocida sp. AWRm77]